MRIVFVGCVKSSEIFLKKLIDTKADIVGVIAKKESKFNSDFVDMGSICETNNIDYLYVKTINDAETKDYIKKKEPDMILCLGWSQLLDEEVLNIPKIGSIGFHPAALPNNRGRHPLIWALALGLQSTASTLFLMDAKADTGVIVSQKPVIIDYEDDASTLYDKVMKVAANQLEEVLDAFEHGTVKLIPQDLSKGNSWRKRGKCDGQIDWRMSSRSIYNLVRALTKPYVGAHFVYGDKEYKVWKVREIVTKEYENIEPGKVISVKSKNNFTVKAGENVIEVLTCDDIELNEGEYL